MKRVVKTLALCLAVAGMGVATSSCDSDTINQIINAILGGQVYTYSGNAALQCLEGPDVNHYKVQAEGTAKMNVQLTSNSMGGTCTIVIPPVTIGDVTLGQLTIEGLQMTSNESQTHTVISNVESNYSIDGTYTRGTLSHPAQGLYITEAVASDTNISLKFSIYYGTDEENLTEAVNLTFAGEVVTN